MKDIFQFNVQWTFLQSFTVSQSKVHEGWQKAQRQYTNEGHERQVDNEGRWRRFKGKGRRRGMTNEALNATDGKLDHHILLTFN